jgi:biopolymer transport protein ExbB/TolQ
MNSSFINGSNFWFNYIAAIGFASATIWGIITFVHRRFIKQVSALVGKEVETDLAIKISQEVEHIYKETTHNGGSSMKDAMRRLEENTNKGFKKIEEQQDDLRRYIVKLDKSLERHFGYHEGLGDE